jgi:aspartate-semialdehyde dehydrogenase
MNKIPIGILGATGIVGQRFIQLLEHHPWFEVAWLAASDRSEGREYADAARWKLRTPIPARVATMSFRRQLPTALRRWFLLRLTQPLRPNWSSALHKLVMP